MGRSRTRKRHRVVDHAPVEPVAEPEPVETVDPDRAAEIRARMIAAGVVTPASDEPSALRMAIEPAVVCAIDVEGRSAAAREIAMTANVATLERIRTDGPPWLSRRLARLFKRWRPVSHRAGSQLFEDS